MSEYLPKPYIDFKESFPEVAEAYQALGKTCHEKGGSLDAKVRHLVKLGVATAVQSEGAVKSHTRQALAAGASPEEIRHAILLVLTTSGFPRMVAALSWASEVLGSEG
jgi:AhpD family alkylhydroperoxidase